MKNGYTIYHNPRCSKSREALKILQENNINPNICLYLEEKLSIETIHTLTKLLKVQVKDIIRIKEKIYRDLSLKDADDNQLIQNILEHPILLERPIIKYKNKAVIGRPPENVLKLIN